MGHFLVEDVAGMIASAGKTGQDQRLHRLSEHAGQRVR